MKKIIRLLCAALICAFIFGNFIYISANATDYENCDNMMIYVDGADSYNVRVIYWPFDGNPYISLRDLASAVSGTDKHFEMSISDSDIYITTGMDYGPAGGENIPFDEEELGEVYSLTYSLMCNDIIIDGKKVLYYTFLGKNDSGKTDCYINLTDAAMMLDLNITRTDKNIYIDTASDFYIDINELDENHYFSPLNGCLVGDVDTGEIFYEYNGDHACAMASTTKLMTYTVLMDAVAEGKVSLDDMVYISAKAEELSKGRDAVIYLKQGEAYPLRELLNAMLIISSNESALALAEHVAGSEEAFVSMMNEKAQSLGMSEMTVFYNPHGLPSYTDNLINTKRQNYISPEDMFILCSYIFAVYPEITDITSLTECTLDTVDTRIVSTNPMLHNVEGVNGLKTGTTDRAGYCLVSSLPVYDGESCHTIVAIELGAENMPIRGQTSEIMLRYGKQVIEGGEISDSSQQGRVIPDNAEELIRMMVNNL